MTLKSNHEQIYPETPIFVFFLFGCFLSTQKYTCQCYVGKLWKVLIRSVRSFDMFYQEYVKSRQLRHLSVRLPVNHINDRKQQKVASAK